MIKIRVANVVNFGAGVYGIEPHETPLTPEQQKVLRDLFPNTIGKAEDLLAVESVLHSITDEPIPESAKAEPVAELYPPAATGKKSSGQIRVETLNAPFKNAWAEMAGYGEVEAVGGAHYLRVLDKWINAVRPQTVKAWILDNK